MTKTFIDLLGEPFEVTFTEHDISKYEVLFHVTSKQTRSQIEEQGLLIGQPMRKSLVETNLLFLSYPINQNTGDLFRWHDETCTLIVLDAVALLKAGYVFYDDYFSNKDQSSLRNHLVCEQSIPKEFITKVIEF
jgi:RNA:NAD 2'-phosphotransferase (TPT1/KptA family)